jgi:hypothetical protein
LLVSSGGSGCILIDDDLSLLAPASEAGRQQYSGGQKPDSAEFHHSPQALKHVPVVSQWVFRITGEPRKELLSPGDSWGDG